MVDTESSTSQRTQRQSYVLLSILNKTDDPSAGSASSHVTLGHPIHLQSLQEPGDTLVVVIHFIIHLGWDPGAEGRVLMMKLVKFK